MADRTVSVTLRAKTDAYNAAMKSAGAASATMASTTTANLSKLGGQMTSMGKSMSVGLTVPMVAAGAASIKMAGDFNQSFTKMTALAGVSAAEIDGLKESVKDLASATGQGPTELAEALYTLRSSGLDAGEAMDALEMSAKASAAGLGETATIADAVSSAMNAYATSGMDAARATDVLVATARAGKAEPEELAGALGRVLPVAAELGVTFEDVGGAVAAFSQTGNDASGSVTLLSNVLMKLLKPSQQGAEMLAKVGLSVQGIRQSIAEDGLLATLQMLSDKLGASNLPMFFEDAQAVNGVMSLLGQNAEGVADTFDQVKNSQGSLGEAFQSWLDGPGSGIQKAWAELQVTLVEVGEELLPIMEDVMGVMADVAGAFNDLPGPVKTAVVALGGLIAIAGPFLIAAGKIAQGIGMINGAGAAGGVAGAAGKAGTLATVGKWATGLGLAGAASWQMGQAAHENRQLNDGSQYGSNPLSRFGNRLIGNEAPTGTMAADFKVIEAAAAGAEKSVISLNSALGAMAGANAGAATLSQTMTQIDTVMGAMAGGMAGGVMSTVLADTEAMVDGLSRMAQAATEYQNVVASAEWGQTGINAAATAVGSFNSYLLDGYTQVANTEAAMDGLAAALENVGTVGVGGMKDLNLATEEGRAAFSALTEVAGAFEPQVAAAVAAAGGDVGTLQTSLAGLNSSFVETAVAAGIPRAEAEALAVAIGLIPANAQTLIDIQGAEEGKLKLDLMSTAIGLLDEKDQVEIALLIANGQFAEAAALAEAKLAELEAATATAEIDAETMAFEAKAVATAVALTGLTNTTAVPVIDANPDPFNSSHDAVQAALDDLDGTTVSPTISATDNASWVIDHVRSGLNSLSDKHINVTTTYTYQGIAPHAEGGYIPGLMLSTLGEEGPEVVLPLTKPDRMRSLVRDPRVTGPILGALGVRGFAEGGVVGSAAIEQLIGGLSGRQIDVRKQLADAHAAGNAGLVAELKDLNGTLTDTLVMLQHAFGFGTPDEQARAIAEGQRVLYGAVTAGTDGTVSTLEQLTQKLMDTREQLTAAQEAGDAALIQTLKDQVSLLVDALLAQQHSFSSNATQEDVNEANRRAYEALGGGGPTGPEGVLAAYLAAHPNMFAGGLGNETPNVIDVTHWATSQGMSKAGLQGLQGTYSPMSPSSAGNATSVTVQSGAVQVSLVSPQVTQGDVNRTVTSALSDLGDRIAAGVAS